jgi:hypothetical protein
MERMKSGKNFYDKFCAYGKFKGWWYTLLTTKSDQDSMNAKQDRAKAKYALTMCVTGDAAKYVRAYKNDPYEGWKAITDRWELLYGSNLKDPRTKVQNSKTQSFGSLS